MTRHEINHCAVRTLPVAAALAAVMMPAAGGARALCFGLSAAWGAANLAVLAWLLEATLQRRSRWTVALAFHLKLASLFGGAALIALAPFFSPLAFVLGFHVALVMAAAALLRRSSAAPEAA